MWPDDKDVPDKYKKDDEEYPLRLQSLRRVHNKMIMRFTMPTRINILSQNPLSSQDQDTHLSYPQA